MFKTSIGLLLAAATIAIWSGAGFSGQKSPAPPKTDLDKLQGVWIVDSAQTGRQVEVMKNVVFMVDGKRACFQVPGGGIAGGIYLDSTTEPKSIDFATTPYTRQWIFAVDGKTLVMCSDFKDEAKRPSGFSASPESQRVLLVMKRVHGPEAFPFRRADGSKCWPEHEDILPSPIRPIIQPRPEELKKENR